MISNKNNIDIKVKRILGKYFDEPVFSKNKFIESVYLFFWKYVYKISTCRFSIKYFFQRHLRGYDDLDKWNAAWLIARKAVPVLKDMRDNFKGTSIRYHTENRHGEIIELSHDEVFGRCKEPGFEHPDALTEEQWKAVLDDIIFAFQWQIDFDSFDGSVSEDEFKKGNKRQKRGLKLFSIYYNNLWD